MLDRFVTEFILTSDELLCPIFVEGVNLGFSITAMNSGVIIAKADWVTMLIIKARDNKYSAQCSIEV
jgi:hypothetical protein